MSEETAASLGDAFSPMDMPTTTMMAPPPTDVDESGFSHSLLTFAAVMTFLIMIVGICGNLLTVVALLKCPKVRNVAAAFIISLCIADLLFCALVLPFQGLRFVQGTWRHGEVLCRLIPFIQYGNIGVSLLCIAMITINRYVMITHHSLYNRIYKRHWIAIMIAACWLFSYGMQLPTLLGAWGRFGYDARLQTCSIMSDRHGHSSKTTLFITAFVIPCLVIIACYAKIFWVVHKSEQRLKRHATKQNSIPNNLRPLATAAPANSLPSGDGANASQVPGAAGCRVSSDSSSSYSTDVPETAPGGGGAAKQQPTRVKDQREVRAKRNEWRITKMVLAIFLSFVICYLPITIVKVADKDVEHPSLHIFSYIMLYLSACINPIIYVIMNKQYRKAYKTVVFCQPAARLLLPFGKGNGASSAAEMERYRIEQQPQPHHRLPDVGRSNGSGSGNGCGSIGQPATVHVLHTGSGSGIGADGAGTRSDQQINESATAAATATDPTDGSSSVRYIVASAGTAATVGDDSDTQQRQQPTIAAQEEQSLLHKQRLQQQRDQPQPQPQSQFQFQRRGPLPARDWLNGERLGIDTSHHHGGGRHYTGGGGAAAHTNSELSATDAGTAATNATAILLQANDNEYNAKDAHLHERGQPEEKPVL